MKRRRVPAARFESFTPPRQFDALWLRGSLQALAGSLRAAQICVAFSGGLDSTALLGALRQLRRRERLQLRALHVNHHLQPGADAWAGQARARCAALGIDCRVIDVTVPKRRGSSPEAAARAVRYAALRTALLPGEWLLTAHHQDDQLETVLLQLLRGAGLPGLAAMPARVAFGAGWLLRPLLPVSRAALVDYLARRKLSWTDDPSNADPRFDRNYLRHEVLPALYRRWPAAAVTVSRSAAHIAEAQSLLDAQADALLATALDGAALRVPALRRLSALECRLAVRRWLRRCGLPIPERSRLQELVTTVLAARQDAAPVVRWEGAEVRRHGELLHAMPPQEASAPQPCRWRWRAAQHHAARCRAAAVTAGSAWQCRSRCAAGNPGDPLPRRR
jgi:tRNA(Ile)-lysidine synthase